MWEDAVSRDLIGEAEAVDTASSWHVESFRDNSLSRSESQGRG
jgi:hypothetical protein